MCGQKTQIHGVIVERSFIIQRENEDVLTDLKSLAIEAKSWSWAASVKSSGKKGWKAVGSRTETYLENTPYKTRDEKVEYYGKVIFQNL